MPPGRPTLLPNEAATRRLTVNLAPSQEAALMAAAEADERPLTSWARDVLLRATTRRVELVGGDIPVEVSDAP